MSLDPIDVLEDQQREQETPQVEAIDDDPTSYIPVMRHHLHEALWAINLAQSHSEAQDLAESYRDALTMPKRSRLSQLLDRSHTMLAGYLGLLDEPEPEGPDSGESGG